MSPASAIPRPSCHPFDRLISLNAIWPKIMPRIAIASLICSIVGIAILGIIFGHIALSEIKRSNGWQEGRGMALAGLIIGYIEIGLTVLVLIVVLGLTLSLKRLPM